MNFYSAQHTYESQIINEILELDHLEYSLIRMTKTMLEKSIIENCCIPDISRCFRNCGCFVIQ